MSPSPLRSLHRRSSFVLAVVVALAVAASGRASAQDGGASSAPPAAPTTPTSTQPPATPTPTMPVADQPPVPSGPPRGGGIVTYHSPMRPTCEDELAKDKDWFDNLKGRLADKLNRDVHQDAANYATKNNQHVVAAYAVFWLFTVGFVLMMWRRQRALQAELARLERDLARVLKEGGAA